MTSGNISNHLSPQSPERIRTDVCSQINRLADGLAGFLEDVGEEMDVIGRRELDLHITGKDRNAFAMRRRASTRRRQSLAGCDPNLSQSKLFAMSLSWFGPSNLFRQFV